jgi:hypothetical protein
MKNAVKIYLTTYSVRTSIPIRTAIRNILFAFPLTALYLLGRQYCRAHAYSTGGLPKIKHIVKTTQHL